MVIAIKVLKYLGKSLTRNVNSTWWKSETLLIGHQWFKFIGRFDIIRQ
jgi:hypothetical protein